MSNKNVKQSTNSKFVIIIGPDELSKNMVVVNKKAWNKLDSSTKKLVMKQEFKIIADLVEKNARVLDVGCGYGKKIKPATPVVA